MRSRKPTTLTRAPLPIKLALGVLLLALAAFGYWTIAPLFVTTRVDEAFPAAVAQPTALAGDVIAAPTAMPAPTAAPVVVTAPTAAPVVVTAPTAAPVVVTAPTAAPTAMPAPTAAPVVVTAPTAAPVVVTAPTVAPTALPAATEPLVLARGSFTQIDRLHGADGAVVIYQLPDGQRVLRFEGFDAKNGPDLRVSLAGHPQPRSRAEAHDQGYIELALLKATQGNQNYVLPADLDLAAFKSVVIYCQAFHVVFSTATLS